MIHLSPKTIKVLKTVNLYSCFVILGLCFAAPGPCLPDLEHLVQTDTQHIAYIYTARSVGFLVGSILGGILLDILKWKQAVMTVCNLVMSTTMILIPWSKDLGTLAGFMVANGVALGTVNTGGNVLCLALWGSENGAFFQALHFAFGVGGLVAPLFAASFLHDFAHHETTPLHLHLNSTHHSLNSTTHHHHTPGVLYPFLIIGCLGEMVGLMHLALCVLSPDDDGDTPSSSPKKEDGDTPSSSSKKEDGDTPSSSSKKEDGEEQEGLAFLSAVVLLNFLLVFVSAGTEIGYAQMITTFVVRSDALRLTPTVGSYMTSAFWAAFTLSRLASVFLSLRVSHFALILLDLAVTFLGAASFAVLSERAWGVWLASVLLGAGIASFFPTAVAWLGCHVTVTGKLASVFVVGSAFGEMVIPFAIGYYIEDVPEVLVYVVALSTVFSAAVVFSLYALFRTRSGRETG